MDPIAVDADRPIWGTAKALVLAVCGAGVGYAGFFRQPYLQMKHGAGNFYFAQLICLILVAWPVCLLELVIGQHFRKGPIDAITQIHRYLRGIPIAALVIVDLLSALYFSAVMSWIAEPYLFTAFAPNTPFLFRNATLATQRDYFFDNAMYSSGTHNYGAFVGLLGLWVLVAVFLFRGVRSVTYLVFIVVPLPLLMYFAMMIYAMSLKGGVSSINTHMAPVWKDLASFSLWADALGHSQVMTQATTGVLIAYGSYTRPVHNCYRLSTMVVLQALLTSTMISLCCSSTFVGLGITPGFQPSLDTYGMYAAPVVYSTILASARHANVFAISFFICILLVGIQSVAATVHNFFTVVRDRFPFVQPPALIAGVCGGCFLLSLPLVFRAGYEFLVAVDAAVLSVSLPLLTAAEMLGVGYMWSDRGIFERVRERGVTGCTKLKTLLVVAYNHSVGHIQELMASQGRTFWGHSALPFFVKLVVPCAGITTAVGNYAATFFVTDTFGLAPMLVGLVFPVITLLIIGAFVALAPSQRIAAPWRSGIGRSAEAHRNLGVGSPSSSVVATSSVAPGVPFTSAASGDEEDNIELRGGAVEQQREDVPDAFATVGPRTAASLQNDTL